MPMFIQFGKAILFEMPQLFFTCAVLYLYILFIKKNDTKLLLIMALCLIISAIIRINGLAPIIPIFFDCVSRKRDKKVIICLVAAVLISVIIHLLYTDYLIGIIIHGLALYMETLNPFIQLNYYMKIFHPIGLILIILSLFFVIFLQDECSEFLLSYILIGF
jgi:4-amino-4-deoxy-L-arabinose transferase-like glycosyltransferase